MLTWRIRTDTVPSLHGKPNRPVRVPTVVRNNVGVRARSTYERRGLQWTAVVLRSLKPKIVLTPYADLAVHRVVRRRHDRRLALGKRFHHDFVVATSLDDDRTWVFHGILHPNDRTVGAQCSARSAILETGPDRKLQRRTAVLLETDRTVFFFLSTGTGLKIKNSPTECTGTGPPVQIEQI